MDKKIKILFSGGGTGGSVTPLLAIYDSLDREKYDFWWIGTKNGPEEKMVEKKGIKYRYIHSGKLRRYFSWKNFTDPMFIFFGFLESFYFLLFRRQDLIITAGSFVSVPLVWAARILRIPVIVHQQDIRPGLANRLMSKSAKVVTTVFEKSLRDYGKKAVWTGNPVRETLKTEKNHKYFDFNGLIPTVLVIGGGTGATNLNKIVYGTLNNLCSKIQIIHIAGKGKIKKQIDNDNYRQFEFLEERDLAKAYAISDIVISRCGIGVLTELSFLSKPSILIPMPNSHQEENAKVFREKNAAVVLDEKKLDKYSLIISVEELLNDEGKRKILSSNINEVMKKNTNQKMIEIIEKLTLLR
ncbi:MAG: undecaprenyldiphospho-muramoylpentapeptide beta-N-acetylglucosaminyltransferase [Patescibacteria group bacterium]|jgi:UDP-N-acetylglucosamine--N-acetylmuramyl-(pentapeptide) pyrophosphoryl-undecaprenol N-acetylglucosamine transferase|nr:undecaprenyldiphospho-muramoylpentapeptide beta-N-acetylglucosaminyltransferase [Patescibacteria group bacterium]